MKLKKCCQPLVLWACAAGLLYSCATTIKEAVPFEDLGYKLPTAMERAGSRPAQKEGYDPNSFFTLGYLNASPPSSLPNIDGDFSDWQFVPGIETQLSILGQSYDAVDADVKMAGLTDGRTIWLYFDVRDDSVSDNRRSLDSAWQDDSIDLYFSTSPSLLRKELGYAEHLLRIVPQQNKETGNVLVGIDNREYRLIQVSLRYRQGGYSVELAVPAILLSEKLLKPGVKLRLSLQYNDGDGNGRDRVLHWVNPNDTSWNNFQDWGRGAVLDWGGTQNSLTN